MRKKTSLRKKTKPLKIIDLSHLIDEKSPHHRSMKPLKVDNINLREKYGYKLQTFHFPEGFGTHIDGPNHFHEKLKTIDKFKLEELILPLVVIDIHKKVLKNSDYTLQIEDILDFEKKHGKILAGCFVALRTDWYKRWPNQQKMLNLDKKGISHTPGWSIDSLKFLYEKRKIKASGHETIDTDPGIDADKTKNRCERYILSLNTYQIELMKNLDKLPATGSLIFNIFINIKNAVGFPVRSFAIINF
ncbi:MAG: cyclase family protein [Parachlamydiales bacterium]|nr:cyclase family protein [Parachlamydiales bacterium]